MYTNSTNTNHVHKDLLSIGPLTHEKLFSQKKDQERSENSLQTNNNIRAHKSDKDTFLQTY